MKKQILNLGKTLTKKEQKEVFGGFGELGYKFRDAFCGSDIGYGCATDSDCCEGTCQISSDFDPNDENQDGIGHYTVKICM